MAEYRNKTTGEVKTQGEWRRVHKNTSLPRTWTAETLDGLNLDPVLEAPKPTDLGKYQTVRRDGVKQDTKGNWVQAWVVVDMFSDYTDDEGVFYSKENQEAEYQARLDAERRSRMVVSRAEFAKAAKREGIILHAEAIAWATQQALPQIVLDVFATLPQADREDAEFEALTSERVRRTAPLITMLQGELSLSDAQVDALFESPDT